MSEISTQAKNQVVSQRSSCRDGRSPFKFRLAHISGAATALAWLIAAPAAFGQTLLPQQPASSASTTAAAATPHFLSPAQQESICNILLGTLYFVLPVGLGLAIFLNDRYSNYRSALLHQQIQLLERLWHQNPQS
jgi:hypothetical protein